MTDRQFANYVVEKLQSEGFTAYWAGGCVRDELLGLTPDDYDIATIAAPEQVQAIFRHTVAIGASFGVIDVIGPKVQGRYLEVQVATFRNDGIYIDGRRPESVTFSSPEEDAQRRDFTINGLFFDPVSGRLIDFVGGQADLKSRILRAIGDAAKRFEEDKLRLMRAVRMATRFDLVIDPATLESAKAMAPQITLVSAERIADELRKLLSHPNRVRGLELLRDFGLVKPILPEIVETFDDAVRLANAVPAEAAFELVFALMLRNLKPEVARRICRRLKLSNDETDAVVRLVSLKDALREAEVLPKSKLYPLLAPAWRWSLVNMTSAIVEGDGLSLAPIEYVRCILETVPMDIINPPPLVTGDDLIAAGYAPGPKFKQSLEALRSAQLDGLLDTKSAALAKAKELFS